MLKDPKDPFMERNSSDAPELDEGWWASVLAEEESYSSEIFDETEESVTPAVEAMQSVDWDSVQNVYDQDEIVNLEVYSFNRGGLLVRGDGIQGFVPISHLVDISTDDPENERHNQLSDYVGAMLQLKVIECEPQLQRIVLSERAALAGEGKRKVLFDSLKEGDAVYGTVTNVTEFGVFVDLGGVEGLIHVSELSWGRVQHPSQVLRVNQKIQTLVLQVSEENVRVALSLKRLYPNPWDSIDEKYQSGDVVSATVTEIMRYGVFARLEDGIEGLIHVSSMGLNPNQKDLGTVFRKGQAVQARILHIDSCRRRLGLGLVSIE